MKSKDKFLYLVLIIAVMFLSGCASDNKEMSSSHPETIVIEDTNSFSNLTKSLKEQPIYAYGASILMPPDSDTKTDFGLIKYKTLDNSSNKTVKKAYIAFVGWDKDLHPVDIIPYKNNDNAEDGILYVVESDLNVAPKSEYKTKGTWKIDRNKNKNIRKVEMIVYKVELDDGSTLVNPQFDLWKQTFKDEDLFN